MTVEGEDQIYTIYIRKQHSQFHIDKNIIE